MTRKTKAKRADVYSRITYNIVSALELGTRPWIRPWNAEHAAGRTTKPLRHCGTSYNGINIIILWQAAMACDYAAPIWMTYRQAHELGGHVRKGKKASSLYTQIRSSAPSRTLTVPSRKSTFRS